MGRHRKNPLPDKPTIPKKRGRRPKKIIDEDNSDDEKTTDTENVKSSVILKFKNVNFSNLDTSESNSSDDDSQHEVLNDVFDDYGEHDNRICKKCIVHEQKIKKLEAQLKKTDLIQPTRKKYTITKNRINLISKKGDKVKLEKTNIKCWHDCHNFDSIPVFLVDNYNRNIYHVYGCFCSINCALAYNLYSMRDGFQDKRKSLTLQLYFEIFNIDISEQINIKAAAPREVLNDYGGDYSIEKFRKSFAKNDKDYIISIPPIKPIPLLIEEGNIVQVNYADNLVLKRSGPLRKKNSILETMNI
jgi:hypothetical protein